MLQVSFRPVSIGIKKFDYTILYSFQMFESPPLINVAIDQHAYIIAMVTSTAMIIIAFKMSIKL